MIFILCVLIAFCLILKGGDLLVESSIWLAEKAKIPSLVVGATVVAIATTFPEVSVAIFSGASGADGLALNTALGSMVCNFALVLGLSFLLVPSTISKSGLLKKAAYFILALCILTLLSLDQHLGVVDAIFLLAIFSLFILSNFLEARAANDVAAKFDSSPSWFKTIFQFVISAFSIGFGASVLVSNIDTLSGLLGVSEGVLGVFVIAVGTNIPEFVTTMTAIRLKNSGIGIGNIFGASIIDATMLIAVTVFSGGQGGISIPIKLVALTVVTLLLITTTVVFPINKNERSSRLQGVVLVALFIIYSIILTKIS